MGKEIYSEAQKAERQRLQDQEFVVRGITDVYAKLTSIFELARAKSRRTKRLQETMTSLSEGDQETVMAVEPRDERLKGVSLMATYLDGKKVFTIDLPTQGITDRIGPDSGNKSRLGKREQRPLLPVDIKTLRLVTALFDVRLTNDRGTIAYRHIAAKKQ